MGGSGKTVSMNVLVLFIRQLFTWGSSFLLLLFLPRYLGPENYGKYYLGQSLSLMFSVLIDFGGRLWITKEISRDHNRAGQIIVDAFALRFIMWVFSFICLNVYAIIAGYDDVTRWIIMIFGLGMLWNAGTVVLSSCFQGFEMLKYPSYSSVATSAFISLVGIAALLLGAGPIGLSIITVLSSVLSFAIVGFFIKKLTQSFPKVILKNCLIHLKQGLPYFFNTLFGTIYYRVDTVMLSLMVPNIVLGWYGASYKFFDALMFVPSILSIAVFPAMTRIWGEGNSMTKSFQKSMDLLFIIGVPISIGMFAFSSKIIELFFGLNGYQPSILILQIFSAGMLLVYIDILLGTSLLASDKQLRLSIVSFVAIFINIGLNYFLIPYTQHHYGNGSIGAAIATLVTEFSVMISMLSLVPKTILAESKVTAQSKILLSGGIMTISIYILHSLHVYWIVQAIVASIIYFGCILITKTLEKSDYELLKAILPGKFVGFK